MMIAVLFTVIFAISGIIISEVVFAKHKFSNRIWLGLVLGLLMLTWLPSLFALIFRFTITAQILSLVTVCILAAVCALILITRKKRGLHRSF